MSKSCTITITEREKPVIDGSITASPQGYKITVTNHRPPAPYSCVEATCDTTFKTFGRALNQLFRMVKDEKVHD